jgi:NTP pyrophosphatase (non-canonical NTP hydrolase)
MWLSVSLNDFRDRAYQSAASHGFHEGVENLSEKLMLVVSELGEACEALRKGRRVTIKDKNNAGQPGPAFKSSIFESNIKDTFEDEIAGAMIRLFDLAGVTNMDLDYHVNAKMQFNESRPYKHGKAF